MSGYLLTFQFSLPHFEVGDNIGLASIYAILAAFSFGSSTVFGKKYWLTLLLEQLYIQDTYLHQL